MPISLPLIANQFLAILGVMILILGIYQVNKFSEILIDNNYSILRWRLIQFLIAFFILGYTTHLLAISTDVALFIGLDTLVTLIYFFGAIYVIISIYFINSTLKTILGEKLSDEEAIEMFYSEFGKIPKEVLVKRFSLDCSECSKNYEYSIVDIIRANAKNIQKGIVVNSTFGVRNFILRPTHKCVNGRREISVIHDKDLQYRSVDDSRIVIAGEF